MIPSRDDDSDSYRLETDLQPKSHKTVNPQSYCVALDLAKTDLHLILISVRSATILDFHLKSSNHSVRFAHPNIMKISIIGSINALFLFATLCFSSPIALPVAGNRLAKASAHTYADRIAHHQSEQQHCTEQICQFNKAFTTHEAKARSLDNQIQESPHPDTIDSPRARAAELQRQKGLREESNQVKGEAARAKASAFILGHHVERHRSRARELEDEVDQLTTFH